MQSFLSKTRGLVPCLLNLSAVFLAVVLYASAAFPQKSNQIPDLELKLDSSGFVSSWLHLGPVKVPLNTDHHPALGKSFGGATWKAVHSRNNGRTNLNGSKTNVGCLALEIRVDRNKKVWLSTGSDGGLEVWLNGALVGSSDTKRRASKDVDLAELNLVPGSNLLVLKLTKLRKGPWRVFARLMDGDFGPLKDARLFLPGAGLQYNNAVRASGKLKLERVINLEKGSIEVTARLKYPGGRPVGDRVRMKVSFQGPGDSFQGPGDNETFEKEIDLALNKPSTIPVWNGILSANKVPSTITVELGRNVFNSRLSFFMKDVRTLCDAWKLLEKSKRYDSIPKSSYESASWRISHLKSLIESGDEDYKYLTRELRKTLTITKDLASGKDYYYGKKARVQRRGFKSSIDGSYSHYALYVPPSWKEGGDKKYGLVVMLHGLNGSPIKSMQDVFGEPLDEHEVGKRRERFPRRVGPSKFFVLAPGGFGNAGYRGLGEVDVLEAMEQVQSRYRIDKSRIYITGVSMGATGAVSIPFHYPDRFAAAVSLSGYHSLRVKKAIKYGHLKRWEKLLVGFRSNVDWAENGRDLPLYLVHGLKDMPRYSGVLYNRYRELGHKVKYETPELGHNVWDLTYKNRRIFKHLGLYTKKNSPTGLVLNTARLRYNSNRWIQVDDASDYGDWSRVDADWGDHNLVGITTKNVDAVTVFNDVDKKCNDPIVVQLDGQKIGVAWDWPFWRFHKAGSRWRQGPQPKSNSLRKRPGLAGPIDDAYYEPLMFIYGTGNRGETALSRRVIEKLRRIKRGVTVQWPVKADSEVTDDDIRDYSLVIVGTPDGNSLLDRIKDKLPIRLQSNQLFVGNKKYTAPSTAAAFVHPNPLNPDRYVLIHTGVSTQALFYAAHLPQLVPDYIVYDASDWGRAGGLVLGDRKVLDAGFFSRDWKL